MNPRAKEYKNTGLVQNSSPLFDLCEYFRQDTGTGFIQFPGAPAWLLDAAEAEADDRVKDSEGYARASLAQLYAAVRNASMRVGRD